MVTLANVCFVVLICGKTDYLSVGNCCVWASLVKMSHLIIAAMVASGDTKTLTVTATSQPVIIFQFRLNNSLLTVYKTDSI